RQRLAATATSQQHATRYSNCNNNNCLFVIPAHTLSHFSVGGLNCNSLFAHRLSLHNALFFCARRRKTKPYFAYDVAAAVVAVMLSQCSRGRSRMTTKNGNNKDNEKRTTNNEAGMLQATIKEQPRMRWSRHDEEPSLYRRHICISASVAYLYSSI
ncbi:GM11370, partial [Drosophila sechellia]